MRKSGNHLSGKLEFGRAKPRRGVLAWASTAVAAGATAALCALLAGQGADWNFVSSANAKDRGGGRQDIGEVKRPEYEKPRENSVPVRTEREQPRSSPEKATEGSKGTETKSAAEEAKRSSEGGERNTSNNRDQKEQKRREGNYNGVNEQEPPRTVAETLERIFKPAIPPPAVPPSAKAKTAAPTVRSHFAPAIGNRNYSGSEVLALNLSQAALRSAQKLGFVVAPSSSYNHIKTTVTRLITPPGMDALQARELLQRDLPLEQFALNKIYRPYLIKSVAGQAQRTEPAGRAGAATSCTGDRCAGRELIGWKSNLERCSSGLRVGVVDTDVDHQHPAFTSGKLSAGNFIPEGRSSAPNWHGTGVLALLAGDPKGGTPGLIPRASFFLANVFFNDGAGSFATDSVSLLKALDWLGAFDVKLVNMSFAGPKDELVEKAIASLSSKGVIFVAAAGNDGPTAEPSYPAAYKQVVAVTAVGKDLRSFPYANRGSHIDAAAPGVEIWTAVPGSMEGYYTGTSFAAPFVTAMLATIYRNESRPQKDDLLTRLEFKDLGTPGRDRIYGRGLLIAPGACQPAVATAGPLPAPADTQVTARSPKPSLARELPEGRASAATASFK